MNHGLPQDTVERIQGVLAAHPEIEKAVLYGSRAKGNYKPGSDIDLTLTGPSLADAVVGRVEDELDDLLLPYTIDLSILAAIRDEGVREHVARVGRVFYQKADNSEVARSGVNART